MTKREVFERIKNILKEEQITVLGDQVDNITDETSLINDFALDSIQILELIVNIEKEFEIECNADELNIDLFDCYADLVDFVYKKVNLK